MRVIAAIDGSIHSQAVVEALFHRVWPQDTIIQIVTVIEDGDEMPGIERTYGAAAREASVRAHHFIDHLVTQLSQRLPGVVIDVQILSGHVRETLLTHAAQWHADLIVVGSHGRTGLQMLLLGSVSQSILQHAGCPVLVARSTATPLRQSGPLHILVGVDHSRFSVAAMDWLLKQDFSTAVTIRLFSVLRPFYGDYANEPDPERAASKLARIQSVRAEALSMLDEFVKACRQKFSNADVHATVCEGDPRELLLEDARRWPADLIVVGSHGRTGITRYLLGSVSSAVAQHAHCSVEVVRYPDLLQYVDQHGGADRARATAEKMRNYDFHPRVHFH